jgi:hypothetical protein
MSEPENVSEGEPEGVTRNRLCARHLLLDWHYWCKLYLLSRKRRTFNASDFGFIAYRRAWNP